MGQHLLHRILRFDRLTIEVLHTDLIDFFVEIVVPFQCLSIVLVRHLIDHLEFSKFYSLDEEVDKVEYGGVSTACVFDVSEVFSNRPCFVQLSCSLQHVQASSSHEEILFTFVTGRHHFLHAVDDFDFVPCFEVELVSLCEESLALIAQR